MARICPSLVGAVMLSPRPSLEERYHTHDGYVRAVTSATARLVDDGFLRQADAELAEGASFRAVLRNLGATTVVGIGVSVNVGMTNFAFDAVNAGYQFVLPRDALAGVPSAYADAVIDNTISRS